MRRYGRAAAILATVAILAGCSAVSQAVVGPRARVLSLADQARALGATSTAELLSDGEITDTEFQEATTTFQSCFRDHGIELGDPMISPVDSVTREWKYPDPLPSVSESATKVMNVCSEAWGLASAAYTATHVSVMDPALMKYVSLCMTDQGYSISPKASKVADLVGKPESDGGAQRSAAERCIQNGAMQLFPDLTSITVQY